MGGLTLFLRAGTVCGYENNNKKKAKKNNNERKNNRGVDHQEVKV